MATSSTATDSSTSNNSQSSGPQSNTPLAGFAVWVAGWALIILVIFLLSRSRAGQAIVYYVAWLSIALVLVTHADSIQTLFQQANITQGQY
jgi:hypothetical protein